MAGKEHTNPRNSTSILLYFCIAKGSRGFVNTLLDSLDYKQESYLDIYQQLLESAHLPSYTESQAINLSTSLPPYSESQTPYHSGSIVCSSPAQSTSKANPRLQNYTPFVLPNLRQYHQNTSTTMSAALLPASSSDSQPAGTPDPRPTSSSASYKTATPGIAPLAEKNKEADEDSAKTTREVVGAAGMGVQTPDGGYSDGRRNSNGEVLHSPIESWEPTPTLNRVQSWNREDKKHDTYKETKVIDEKIGSDGQRVGFTEGGPGTRMV